MKLAAMNINFDSMSQMYGFPVDYHDPSYDKIARRFFDLSDRYGFKYTIYVIGKDLENAEHAAHVREWAERGHEIGNHTWSHPLNLGALKPLEIRMEIEKAHAIITKTIGHEPKGFIAPAWCTSGEVLKVLKELHYAYDTSVFPSWFVLPLMGKLMTHHWGSADFFKVLQRKDIPKTFWAPRRPHRLGGSPGLLVLPLPTNRYRIPCWHTMAFMLKEKAYRALLRSCLEEEGAFYYLMHPGDLLDAHDLDSAFRLRMERVRPSLEAKRRLLERCIEVILESGRSLVTMETLARDLAEKEGVPA